MTEKSNNGIYYIQNTITGQLYIGQTSRLDERESEHFRQLRDNCHFNKHLQNSYNKYGEDAFKFEIIERCSPECLDKYEKAYVDMYNLKKHGFNICDGGLNVCPDNSNEKHGMWRQDISNEKIKELYLGDYTAKDLAKYFDCSRRTIERRLRKIFGDEYDVLKKQKHLKGISETNFKDENISDEEICRLAKAGFNSVEIAEKIGCSDSTVMDRLKSLWPIEEYNNYKKKNAQIKMAKLRSCRSEEYYKKIAEKHKKYTLWNGSNVHYKKGSSIKDWNRSFYVRYNSKDVKIGKFIEFVSPQIVHDLILDFS